MFTTWDDVFIGAGMFIKSLGCDPSNAAISAAALRGVVGCVGDETPFRAAQRSRADREF